MILKKKELFVVVNLAGLFPAGHVRPIDKLSSVAIKRGFLVVVVAFGGGGGWL